MREEPYDRYVDLDDPINANFQLYTKWRLKCNHYEYCEYDRRKLTEEHITALESNDFTEAGKVF